MSFKRETTFQERSLWGVCPTCKSPHGTPCNVDVGFQLGSNVNGERLKTGDGAHLTRLRDAPEEVDDIPKVQPC